MAIRFYIVPAIRKPSLDPAKLGQPNPEEGLTPSLLSLMQSIAVSSGDGTPPLEGIPSDLTGRDGQGNRQYRQMYYVMRINADDFTLLDAEPTAIRLNQADIDVNAPKLSALGINITGINSNTPAKTIERRVIMWLRNENLDIEQKKGRIENISQASLVDVSRLSK